MDEKQRIEIGGRIRDLRNASPQTNRSIADYVGVKERAVANWVAGSTGITYEHCKTVAKLFKVDHNWLWGGDPEAAPDLMGALSADDSERLRRVEEKLDELLRRTSPPQEPPGTGPPDEGPPGSHPPDEPIPPKHPPDEADTGEAETG